MLQSLVPIGHLNGLIDGIYIENLLAGFQRAERQGLCVRNGAILEEFLHIVDQGLVKLGVTPVSYTHLMQQNLTNFEKLG